VYIYALAAITILKLRKTIVILGSLIYLLPGCINNNAIFKIAFKREACFGSEESTLTIYREGDSIITRLITNNQLIKETKLDYPYQSAIPAFVNDLKKTESKGMCTTVDTYVV